ncbi:LLM class F420-dependent oxidoreductase [Pseudonocardia sulfidoxydans NBRC 16205]|uniref:LLM class F420-dependent oxidoreductase n=1 Tax=Pseudonocardia sulfidoxydans NBRC 16205 TaxID=1223511 RepID=A0A511DNW5_9PSEU|nr:TIGR03619 family F420-dependent LLM class oxidoreductase [Pseudonocardia sulfidoxydans]GEL26511.1 LLM class F420-dependent oxidoreductase [Pseudonocardia sulfidoxydans NBRC 16205]
MTVELPLIGFGLPVSGSWATPDTMRHIASRAEELGYASLWTFQRLLNPVDADLGEPHRTVFDSVVALAHVAGCTSRIGLGTATLCAPFTPPALLAKTTASLDVLTAGRLTVGLGIGWMPQEYAAAGVPFTQRGARMDEYLRCLQALWTQDPVEFDGDFYTVPRSHVAPRPVQQPHPPLLLGGTAAPALRRAGRLAQGWISSSHQDLSTVRTCAGLVREGAAAAGRDPSTVRIVVRGVVDLLPSAPPGARRPLQGTREQILDDLAALRAHGATEVFLDLNLLPRVGSPSADAATSVALAEQVLDAFAPTTDSAPAHHG